MTDPKKQPASGFETEIAGSDALSNGGVPGGKTTLLAATAGHSKAVFTVQFLACGISSADRYRLEQTLGARAQTFYQDFPESGRLQAMFQDARSRTRR